MSSMRSPRNAGWRSCPSPAGKILRRELRAIVERKLPSEKQQSNLR